jgi:hypothetical protein
VDGTRGWANLVFCVSLRVLHKYTEETMDSRNPFASMHKDVLDASPEDLPGKEKLVVELKDRAKGFIVVAR